MILINIEKFIEGLEAASNGIDIHAAKTASELIVAVAQKKALQDVLLALLGSVESEGV